MRSERHPDPVRVGLVVVEETAPAVLYSLFEVFGSVGTVWESLTGNPARARRMRPTVVAASRGLLRCGLGAPVLAEAAFADAVPCDVVICPDLHVPPDEDTRGRWHEATAWLRTQHAAGAIVGSVCTGGLLLAEAGLLDDEEATTHWGVVALFRRCYPQVRLRPERVLALAGPGQTLVTAGGAASWVELALYLVARFSGQEEAVRISKVFLLGDRSAGQLPFAAMVRPRDHSDAVVEQCQAWIAEHYQVSNPVARMVDRSGLAPRTFKRRFHAATGYTPMDYVQTLRIEEAKQMLEACDLPTDRVGAAVGYDDPASFRRLFRRRTGITPARYRQRFRGIAPLA